MDVWVEQEVEQCEFADQRLKTRLAKLLGELGRKIGDTLPTACQDWAATKAAVWSKKCVDGFWWHQLEILFLVASEVRLRK
jgi:hypothetical protein